MRLKNKLITAGCVLAATAALVAGSACNEHELSPFSKSLSAGKLQNVSSGSARAVDILFVIDNSNSMEKEQQDLDSNFNKFLDRLIEANADFHLAAVSTEWPGNANIAFVTDALDRGNGVSGGDVLLNANQVTSADITAIKKTCANYFSTKGASGAVRRFIASSDEEITSLTGDERKARIRDLFRCEAIMGIDSGTGKAGIERGLATMIAALTNDTNVNDYGNNDIVSFKRKGSILAIVFVTDENDCSDVIAEDGVQRIVNDLSQLKLCETERNIEDSCTISRDDRIISSTSGDGSSDIRLASGDLIEYNGVSQSLRDWCVQGDKQAREALQQHYDKCILEKRGEDVTGDITDEQRAQYAEACAADYNINCPNGKCSNKLNTRAGLYDSVLELVINSNRNYYETQNKDALADKDDDEKAELLKTLAKQDVIVANIINRDRGVRGDEAVTDKWCGGSGNPSYRYQLFAEMFDNSPIYAPICCRREAFFTAIDGSSAGENVVCSADASGDNSNFGPVLGLIGKRIGEAVNTLCTETAPLTCEPSDCNVVNDDGSISDTPLDKPKAACTCLYGCNTKQYMAGSDRAYYLCNEFRFNIGTIDENAKIMSSEDASYSQYVDGTDYTLDYESNYCYTRTGSPIQINLQKAEANKQLVIEYPKRVSAN